MTVTDGSTTTVSVVVPTRDRPALLAEALASIHALAGPDLVLEILVCDNGGLPETARVARAAGARHLPVARIGAGAARNAGLQAATGDYLAFLDDDDLWLPGHLRPQLDLLAARPDLDAVVGQVVSTDDGRMPTSPPWPAALPDDGDLFRAFLADYPQIGATVARVGVRASVGPFDEALLGDQDWDWHLRLTLRHRVGFRAVPGVLFRQRPGGSFDDLEWSRLGYMSRVFFRALRRGGRRLPPALRTARLYLRHRRAYYAYFVESARRHLDHGDRRPAWTALGRALVASPAHAARDLAGAGALRTVVAALMLHAHV